MNLEDLEDGEFRTIIEATTSFEELLLRFENTSIGEHEDYLQLCEKALSLATTSHQAVDLWNESGKISTSIKGADFDNRVLEKMVELVKTHEDIKKVYYVFGSDEQELERRHLVRKIFDKADKLGFPTI